MTFFLNILSQYLLKQKGYLNKIVSNSVSIKTRGNNDQYTG